MAARFVSPSPVPVEENVFLALPWCSKLGTNLRSPAHLERVVTKPIFPFPSVPVDRSASAVLRYGCWPALFLLRHGSLCRSLSIVPPTVVRLSWEKKEKEQKKKKKKKG